MNPHLQNIVTIIQEDESISADQKLALMKLLKAADKELEIAVFKLDRTEKVKRTTAILLEETIEELEQKRKAIEETNSALTNSLSELKSAQGQLIQAEKMASLGELTAGIAHEIQNPLNFVNNFSEVSQELLQEMKTELDNGNAEDAKDIADDVIQNLHKIVHHGKRADSIVKGMLQHSRSGSGIAEPTNINELVDEYLRLAFHGFRSKDNSFNAAMRTDYDDKMESVTLVKQDIGRVILNLITNAFYAVNEKKRSGIENFNPTVLVTTRMTVDNVTITVADNGNGIAPDILDKILQPFFTTKPTGQGTGLGLSLSYDIVKAHRGELKVTSIKGAGAEFSILLPVNNDNL